MGLFIHTQLGKKSKRFGILQIRKESSLTVRAYGGHLLRPA
jgi:hypothetical protein